jgi:hypothetical protein
MGSGLQKGKQDKFVARGGSTQQEQRENNVIPKGSK